jgi:transcriptional regulator with XRE-family HTH domain
LKKIKEMNLALFGKNIQIVREEILHQTQTEFAETLNSPQVIISRLERGVGVDIRFFFDVLEYFNRCGFAVQYIFYEPFSIQHFAPEKKTTKKIVKTAKSKKDAFLKEFGLRLRTVREDVLQLTQAEYAKELNLRAPMISRLESGIGGNVHIVFKILNSLNKRNLVAANLFANNFQIELLNKNNKSVLLKPEEVIWMLRELQKSFNEKIEKIINSYS